MNDVKLLNSTDQKGHKLIWWVKWPQNKLQVKEIGEHLSKVVFCDKESQCLVQVNFLKGELR